MNNRFFKNLWIYPRFQTALLISFMSITIVNIILFYASTQYFFSVFRGKGIELGIPSDHIFFSFISGLENDMSLIFIVATLISLALVAVIGLFLSHKIAGPLYRLSQDLKQMNGNKKLRKISFRKGDYCLDIERNFNEVVDTLNQ